MISLKQVLLLSLLAGGAAAVWVPEFRAKLPTFLTGETAGSQPAKVGGLEARSSTVQDPAEASEFDLEVAGPGMSTQGKNTLPPAKQWVGMLRNFQASRPIATEVQRASQVEPVDKEGESFSLASWQSELVQKPLTAIMVSSKGSRAIFGGRGYTEGENPVPGVTIQSIHSSHVILSDGKREHHVNLPEIGSKPVTNSSVFSPSPQSSAGSSAGNPTETDAPTQGYQEIQ